MIEGPDGYNAGDEVQVKTRRKKLDLVRQRQVDAHKRMLDTADGRAFCNWILDLCGINRTSFATNAIQMGFNEGQRNVGLQVLAEVMEVNPESYRLMQSEAFNKTDD